MTSKNIYTGPKVRDTRTFIQKAKWRHGDRYDYSITKYVDGNTPTKIMCKNHGVFEQAPKSHCSGAGCRFCYYERASSRRRDTTEGFIEKATSVHGDRYDYSRTEYSKSSAKLSIICRAHGVFVQQANSHLNGRGCPTCADTDRGAKRRTPKNIHIARFRSKHGDKYDYSNLPETFLSDDKIEIVCKDHGVFMQSPELHYRSGCPKCVGRGKTSEGVVEEFKSVHGGLYDYSLVEYIHPHDKVRIICELHGEFLQSPANHLAGHGCNRCACDAKVGITYTEESCSGRNGFLYLIRMWRNDEDFYKIGITSRNCPTLRMRDIASESGYSVEMIGCFSGSLWDVFVSEQLLHEDLRSHSYTPFSQFGGYTECYLRDSFSIVRESFSKIKMKSHIDL